MLNFVKNQQGNIFMVKVKKLKNDTCISLRMEKAEWQEIQQIAALESHHTHSCITGQDLIRDAIHYVYSDNERLRECFRRSRNVCKRVF
jgi:hypothetical protein